MRRQDAAFGRLRAWLYDRARILTLAAQTGERVRTVTVLSALGFDFRLAIDVRVSGVVRRAAAYRQMVQHPAFRARRAGTIVNARIDTLYIYARVIARTVAVAVAADHAAAI